MTSYVVKFYLSKIKIIKINFIYNLIKCQKMKKLNLKQPINKVKIYQLLLNTLDLLEYNIQMEILIQEILKKV